MVSIFQVQRGRERQLGPVHAPWGLPGARRVQVDHEQVDPHGGAVEQVPLHPHLPGQDAQAQPH